MIKNAWWQLKIQTSVHNYPKMANAHSVNSGLSCRVDDYLFGHNINPRRVVGSFTREHCLSTGRVLQLVRSKLTIVNEVYQTEEDRIFWRLCQNISGIYAGIRRRSIQPIELEQFKATNGKRKIWNIFQTLSKINVNTFWCTGQLSSRATYNVVCLASSKNRMNQRTLNFTWCAGRSTFLTDKSHGSLTFNIIFVSRQKTEQTRPHQEANSSENTEITSRATIRCGSVAEDQYHFSSGKRCIDLTALIWLHWKL